VDSYLEEIIIKTRSYMDQYDLVQPEQGKTSQNGLHFTGLAGLYLNQAGHGSLDYFREYFISGLRQCEIREGIYNRSPHNRGDQNSIDDYMGIAVCSSFLDKEIGERVLWHWRRTGGVFKNSDHERDPQKTWFWRFPALLTTFQMSVGEKPDFLSRIYWLGAIIWASLQGEKNQDSWRMSFMMICISYNRGKEGFICWLARKIWSYYAWMTLRNGIGKNNGDYLQRGKEHPFVRYLWDVYGPKLRKSENQVKGRPMM